ncbi:hypothetical protein SeLEV6574_g04765 [Synchytrium endobioticum]|uniref:Uncharacterized protein n=1 Tax=Synchytrium endobioticum TaxID=286115 RepID=A0A507CXW1_9FUNG|nr:hypothetical protein SeLEV6574_g04765 [Synchytrium endobioticum]
MNASSYRYYQHQPSQLSRLLSALRFHKQSQGVIVPYNYFCHYITAPNLNHPVAWSKLELWLRNGHEMMQKRLRKLMDAIEEHPHKIHVNLAGELDFITQTDQYLGLPLIAMPSIEKVPLDITWESYRRMCEVFRDFGDTKIRIRIFLGKYKCIEIETRLALVLPEEQIELQAEQSLLLNAVDSLTKEWTDRDDILRKFISSLPREDPRLQPPGWPYAPPPQLYPNYFDRPLQSGIYSAETSTMNQNLFGGTQGVGYDAGHTPVSQPLNSMHPRNYGGDLGQTSGHGNTAGGDVRHTPPGRDEGPLYRHF